MKKVIAFLLAVVALLSLFVIPCFAVTTIPDDDISDTEWRLVDGGWGKPSNYLELSEIEWNGLDFNAPRDGHYVFDGSYGEGMDCYIRVTDPNVGSLILGQQYLRLNIYTVDDTAIIEFVGNDGEIILSLNNGGVVGGYIYNPGSHPEQYPDFVLRENSVITIWYNALYSGSSDGYLFDQLLDTVGDGVFRSQFAETSYTLGYDQGYSDGHKHGVMQGENAGLAAGYEIGYQEGLNENAQDAYDNGYSAALELIDSGQFGVQFLGSTFGAPFNALNEIVLVESDGLRISVLTVFWTLCAIMLFVWFLKLFAGG